VDAGHHVNACTRRLWRQAQLVLAITTTDDAAVMSCYAAIKQAVTEDRDAAVYVLVNRCERPKLAADVHRRLSEACRQFLGCPVTAAPSLPPHALAGETKPAVPRVWEAPDSPFGHAALWLGRFAIDVLAEHAPAAAVEAA